MNLNNNSTRSTSTAALLQRRLVALRTMTIARVTKVLANGWVELDPQIQQVVRNVTTQEETTEDIPPLCRVPIGYYKAGGFILTLPTAVGDEGIILFSDRSLDLWKETGAKNPPRDTRFHDLSDGVFLPFPTSKGGAIAGYNATSFYAGLENGAGFLRIAPSGAVTIHSSSTITLDAPDVNMTNRATAQAYMMAANFLTPGAGGFSAITHKHSGVTAGINNSGPYTP